MTKEIEEYNGVSFSRTDMEDSGDITIALSAPDIVQVYKDQFDIGNIVTKITICEDGTMLLFATKMEEV